MATRIVALSGPAGSGKSVAADYLKDHFGFTSVKFAGPLKAMLGAYYQTQGLDLSEIDRRIEGDLKEVPDPYLNGRTPREAMIFLGTEWGRDLMSPTFWIDAWKRAVEAEGGTVVVDDCRFPNEAAAIKEMGGEVVRLKPKVQRRKKTDHVSEAGLPDDLVDHEIINDGTIQDLRVKVADAVFPMILFEPGDLA